MHVPLLTPLLERLPVVRRSDVVALREQMTNQVAVAENNTELLRESMADLERQLSDPGWSRLLAGAAEEFSPSGLVQLRAICRLYAVKSPLIKRGLALRCAYVWGQGVQIAARADGRRAGEQDVNAVVQDFLGDDTNARAVTGSSARERLERCLGTDGEVWLTLFTDPVTGRVQVRVMPADEITEVISNPDDASEPWYYRRRWVATSHDEQGVAQQQIREAIYPALDYRPEPRGRRASFGSVPVAWDSPLLHVKVNDLQGWTRGIPDCYAAVDWAKAYKEFLEDWARLMRSLSRYAWKATAKGSAAAAVKTRLAQAPSTDAITGAPNTAGATAVLSPDAALEAINKSGATIDAESGRPLAMMVASALDVPVTMLLSDPGQTGARATAETLDSPTELMAQQRREVWAATYRRVLRHVVVEAVRAPKGPLRGTLRRDPASGREYLALAGDTDPTVDVVWPALGDVDPATLVHAIVEAASTMMLPPEQVARLLLLALGVRDVDDLMAELVDEAGNFRWPNAPPLASSPADAQRAGQDPAAIGPGPMAEAGAGWDDDDEDQPP